MWSKFDDQFYLNPKNALIDRDEQDLHIAAIIYCNGQLTDGFVPNGALPMLFAWAKLSDGLANAKAIASRLVEHCYWEIAENGYQIHDWADWNLTRDEVLALKAERSEAGRRGGLAKAKAIAKQKLKQMPSKNVPSTSTSTLINNNDDGSTRPEIFDLYEKEIGPLTGKISEWLKDAEKRYPPEWIRYAFDAAIRANVRRWNYIDGVLKRIEVEGFQPNRPTEQTNRNNGKNSKPSQFDDEVAKLLEKGINGKR